MLAAGCSKKDAKYDKAGAAGGGATAGEASAGGGAAAPACKPLTVTKDGTPLAAMPNGLAKMNNMNGDISYEVQVFDHDKATCEDLLNKEGRGIPPGEVSVRAWVGGRGAIGKGVAIGSRAQMGVDVTLVSDKPKSPGDVVKLCVNNASITSQMGADKGKTVVIDGLLEGTYCGEMKF